MLVKQKELLTANPVSCRWRFRPAACRAQRIGHGERIDVTAQNRAYLLRWRDPVRIVLAQGGAACGT